MRSKRLLTGFLMLAALLGAAPAAAGDLSRPPVTWLRGEGNFTKAHRGPAAVDEIVVHSTEGSFWGSVRWLQSEKSHASAHYVVSRSGKIVQLVHDSDIAWHAGNWNVNERSIGIEHEGYADGPLGFTDAQYVASAKLAAWIARRAVMPIDRAHLIGHAEVPHPSKPGVVGGFDAHTDPGPRWNWTRYLKLVKRYAARSVAPPLTIRSTVANGALVDGPLRWGARPTRRVTRVEFRVDGRLLWRDHRAPYAFAQGRGLNTALLKNGAHVLEVRAVAPGKSVAERTTVRVRNAAFAIASARLHDGQDVRGVLRVPAKARGAEARAVTLLVDGKPVSRDARTPFSLRWDTRRARDGAHRLTLVARAADGREARHEVRVLVDNRVEKPRLGPPPQVVSQSLANGAVVSGAVEWSAHTKGSVAAVEFLVDGAVVGVRTERPIRVMWDAYRAAPGEHVLTVRAVALDGRTAESAVRVVVAG